MSEPNEMQALSKISTEIDESQINVILSSQCIKAQSFLLDKLKKQSERHKEVCGFINSANLKLECEIKQAELEIQSQRNALETIKHANVELKKEYLLAKEKRSEILDRIKAGEKKYDQLWLESKSRYESIPFVKKLLQAQSNSQALQEELANYANQAHVLSKEIENKTVEFKILDNKRVIQLAQYLVHDMPKTIEIIRNKTNIINELTKEFETIDNELKPKEGLPQIRAELIENAEVNQEEKGNIMCENNWPGLNDINDDTLMMPTFDESSIDLDMISDKLKQVKKDDLLNYTIEGASALSSNEKDNQATKYDWNILNMEPYISPYFTKVENKNNDTDKRYSEKKLINILDDLSVGKQDVYNILSKVNPKQLQKVTVINSNIEASGAIKQNVEKPMEREIEEINAAPSFTDNIVVPPTQFLDLSQEKYFGSSQHLDEDAPLVKESENAKPQHLKSSQDATKHVSFNMSTSMEVCETTEKLEKSLVNESCETINNPLDNSTVSDEDFQKIKDMVLKKHQLDSSPEFVYSKNTLQTNNSTSANAVTSKFFEHDNNTKCDNVNGDGSCNKVNENVCTENKSTEEHIKDDDDKMEIECEDKEAQNNIEQMEVDNVLESKSKVSELQKASVSGLLFTHGSGTIPESLNTSISTTGYEDGDGDFPHFIDSNLLLSPKADTQTGVDNNDVKSQDVPNFLSGLRKTGLSLFGVAPSNTKTENNNQNQTCNNNFSFNFGGAEKKSRGGFFNMFN